MGWPLAFERSNLRTKVYAGMKENHRMNNATRSFVFFSCPRESPDQPKGPLRMIFRLFVTSNDQEAARNKGGARFEPVKGASRQKKMTPRSSQCAGLPPCQESGQGSSRGRIFLFHCCLRHRHNPPNPHRHHSPPRSVVRTISHF